MLDMFTSVTGNALNALANAGILRLHGVPPRSPGFPLPSPSREEKIVGTLRDHLRTGEAELRFPVFTNRMYEKLSVAHAFLELLETCDENVAAVQSAISALQEEIVCTFEDASAYKRYLLGLSSGWSTEKQLADMFEPSTLRALKEANVGLTSESVTRILNDPKNRTLPTDFETNQRLLKEQSETGFGAR